ncbi:pyruvate:ferredoxin (flavodoxin) oxidoreductase [Candidatus Woesearchaeota archaeon]|nr:pyruvate:ferredoxin (flavodoxin) oxidoreductase [Candidatus Woesearchaeota archaeon]
MPKTKIIDGNHAAAHVAYAFSEVASIYPITPASPMGELADSWANVDERKNIFGQKLDVIEMQSEAGAAGAVHGSLSAGALTTTFTNSQGLLLMLPNMFKIAGEMLPAVFHVASRSLACQSLSIFADHSDVMAARGTGFALLSSGSVQEAHDLAVISHLSTLKARVPFLHFFEGFRVSHEISKINVMEDDKLKSMLERKYIDEFKARALKPEEPYAKVGAQNPDVYFQGRETVNKYYDDVPKIVKGYMALFNQKTGRKYSLFEYSGDRKAEKVIIAMGCACETIDQTIRYLNKKGEKLGLIKVRLYRPFSVKDFIKAVPETAKKIIVLDRTKEPGSVGEPLYLDVASAIKGKNIEIIGGRYGLSSKEFTPSMVKAVFDNAEKHGFTVGINDDITKRSINVKEEIDIEPASTKRCKFWGLGQDGTVSGNKNSIKVIGNSTNMDVQAYFEYDAKKCGGITRSYLRFGKNKIHAPYLPDRYDFIGIHNEAFIGKYDLLEGIKEKGNVVINAHWKPEDVFSKLTLDMQKTIIKKNISVYVIDAYNIAKEIGLRGKINTIMQAVFFELARVIEPDKAIKLFKDAVEKYFMKKGEKIIHLNWKAIDLGRKRFYKVKVPSKISDEYAEENTCLCKGFMKDIACPIMRLKGDNIPVSKMPLDGSVPTGTTRYEKRKIAEYVPKWIPEKCIQCGRCSFVCPHASIRVKQIDPKDLKDAPKNFITLKSNTKNDKGLRFRVQVYDQDCVGCSVCVEACPTDALKMVPHQESDEKENAEFFDKLPDIKEGAEKFTVKGSQFHKPLFEFSGACVGCGEAPYIKLVTQLFGSRMIIANATGCTSIYGGTFPTIPYCKDSRGHGPAWANSLFEDNAEYGFGMRLAIDHKRNMLYEMINNKIKGIKNKKLKDNLSKIIKNWNSTDDEHVNLIEETKELLSKEKDLEEMKDYLLDKSVWCIGGDGWAYDIGYGGLDHVIAKDRNVNLLVLDTEVYSNTGGQSSKATPLAAVAKFASSGKKLPKKNLGLMAMTYGYVYVASVDLGADFNHVLKVLKEAEAYDGPSLIIAYSPCNEHGVNLKYSLQQGQKASRSGYWPLYRFDPRLALEGKNPLQWDSKDPSIPFKEYIKDQNRYNMLKLTNPEEADSLIKKAEDSALDRFETMKESSGKE